MEDIFGRYAVIAFGAMFAALVAGFFAYMNLVVSKEQKVSEFRQEWIDSLRKSVSCYISSLAYLSVLYKHNSDLDDDKKEKYAMARDVEETYAKVNESYNDIIFRINENEKDTEGRILNNDFLDALRATRNLYNESKYKESRDACEKLRDKTKPLLKFEWDRVKSGEENYKEAKKLSKRVLGAGIILSCLNLFLIWHASSNAITDNQTSSTQNCSSLKESAQYSTSIDMNIEKVIISSIPEIIQPEPNK